MKFEIEVNVTTKKGGIDLLDEYKRLNWEEGNHEVKFYPKTITVEVSEEFAREYKTFFEEWGGSKSSKGKLWIDLSITEGNDWEDWGSVGMVLSPKRMTESRVRELIEMGGV